MRDIPSTPIRISGEAERVLVVTRYWPVPPINGAFKYTNQVVDALKCFDVRVLGAHYVGVSALGGKSPLVTAHIAQRIIAWVVRRLPVAASLFETSENHEILSAALEERSPSVVVLDHIASTWAMRPLQSWKRKHSETTFVYVAHNIESKVRGSAASAFSKHWVKRLANLLDASWCARAERSLASFSSLVVCISPQDRDDFKKYGASRVVTFHPAIPLARLEEGMDYRERPRRVLILGSFIWDIKRQNLTRFLEASASKFARENIEIKVVGWMEEPHLANFRSAWPQVNFTGFVENPEDEVRDARLGLVIDEAGGGFKLKLLDYVAAGLPIAGLRSAVGSDIAADGGNGLILADNFADLCEQVTSVIDSGEVLGGMQRASKAYFTKRHDPAAAAASLLDAVAGCRKIAIRPHHAG